MVDESEAAVPPIAKTRLIRSRRQMYLQIVAATVILACGIIIGSGGALLHFKDDIVPDRLPPSREIARDIRTRYALTEEQTEKVEAAIGASSERMHTIFPFMNCTQFSHRCQAVSASKTHNCCTGAKQFFINARRVYIDATQILIATCILF